MDRILPILQRRGALTLDQGGNKSSTEVVDSVLDILTTASSPASVLDHQQPMNNIIANEKDRSFLGNKTAVLVLDTQNDFVAKEGIASGYCGDMDRMAGLISHIPRVLLSSRQQGHEVIFVRFLGDKRYQLPNIQHRDAVLGKRPK